MHVIVWPEFILHEIIHAILTALVIQKKFTVFHSSINLSLINQNFIWTWIIIDHSPAHIGFMIHVIVSTFSTITQYL